MRDAVGGVFSVQTILIFIVLVSGYLAFSINYTRAFRVKNKIIDSIEQYEGDIDKVVEEGGDVWCYVKGGCSGKGGVGYEPRDEYITKVGTDNGADGCNTDLGFCWKKTSASSDDNGATLERVQYRVYTVIYINIPVINRVYNLSGLPSFFTVTGDTKTIIKHK